MEEIHDLVTGRFRLNLDKSAVDDDEEEEEDGGDMQFLPYKDVASLGPTASLVQYYKPRRAKGDLLDLHSDRVVARVMGNFHLHDPWWQLTILRTKKNKDKVLEPKDYWALCYRLRDDPGLRNDNVAHLFLTKIWNGVESKNATEESWFRGALNLFYDYLKEQSQYDDLDLSNLEEIVLAYYEASSEEERGGLVTNFKQAILLSSEYKYIKVSQAHPQMFHFLSQLFPGHFLRLVTVDTCQIDKLATLLDEEPGLLAFKEMLKKRCGLLGFETSSEALMKSGLMRKVPQDVMDAIFMYEYLKKETRENGHTCVYYDKILDVLRSRVKLFEESLEFLNSNKITKTVVEGGQRLVYLTSLWKSENQIAKGISSLIKNDLQQPWKLDVDWDREDYASICSDNDQLRAARLISTQPVVAISGKGGCGKTYVVTKIITTAEVKRLKQTNPYGGASGCTQNRGENPNDAMEDDLTQPNEDDSYLPCEEQLDDEDEERKTPDKMEMLLTAPTGKAANLLGKRAKTDSYTLHQIIFSYRLKQEGMPWKHKDVNTLVVDECSLVSVSTFAFVIELLLKHAKLRKIVLLGDVRQLPSIEPGNFLADAFSSLDRLGCSVELRTNHRAESQMIVDNATRISKKIFPLFDKEKFVLRKLPESNPSSSGNDYTSQDINEEVMRLLNHEALFSHVNSQFISFTRRICESINDLCCSRYNNHRIKENGKFVFRTGDKICCTKNGYVNLYEYSGGRMVCLKQNSKSDEPHSEGGVDRLVTGEELETTDLQAMSGNQSTDDVIDDVTTASSSTQSKKKGSTQKSKQIRLTNGEIFFIIDEKEIHERGNVQTYFQLSDKDPDPQEEFIFWVDKKQFRQACKIRHAWARTIHTFQGSENDNIIYIVGSRSWRQNWQHVYTAVTRGRKSVFIVGQESILRNAVKRSEIKRMTSLKKQMIEMFQKNKNVKEMLAPGTPMKGQVTANKNLQHKSHDPLIQPMGSKITSDKDASLNNTQMVTDILASLADEHDFSEEIEEYDSDNSQSIFTAIKQARQAIVSEEPARQAIVSEEPARQAIVSEKHISRSSTSRQENYVSNIMSDNENIHSVQESSMARGSTDMIMRNPDNSDDDVADDNTDSDSSQSLLSPPTRNTVQKKDVRTGKKSVRNVDQNEEDSIIDDDNIAVEDSDADSDSQSLLASPVKSSILQNNKTTSETNKQSDVPMHGTQTCQNGSYKPRLSLRRRGVTQVRYSDKETCHTPNSDSPHIHLLGGRLASNSGVGAGVNLPTVISDNKLIKANGVLITDDSYSTPLQTNYHNFTPVSGSGVNQDSKITSITNHSPVTPIIIGARNFSPADIHSRLKTSSPCGDNSTSDFYCHISSGLSPLEPGYSESLASSLARKSMGSPINFYNKSSMFQDSPCDPNDPKRSRSPSSLFYDERRLSELDKEPKSNESVQSQWSEIDESEYLHMADESIKQIANSNVKSNTRNSGGRQSLTLQRVNLLPVNKSTSNIDLSTNSQWSEVDDDQFMTLDLDDITSMTQAAKDITSSVSRQSSCQTQSHSETYREPNHAISPPTTVIDISPTANVTRIPGSISSSPRSMSSSPRKRRYQGDEDSNFSVSPLKCSLSKLNFK